MAIPPKVYNQHPRARGMRPGFVPALSGIFEGTPCEGGGSSRAARSRQAVNTCGEGVCPGFVRRLSRVCPDFAFRRAAAPACCFGVIYRFAIKIEKIFRLRNFRPKTAPAEQSVFVRFGNRNWRFASARNARKRGCAAPAAVASRPRTRACARAPARACAPVRAGMQARS